MPWASSVLSIRPVNAIIFHRIIWEIPNLQRSSFAKQLFWWFSAIRLPHFPDLMISRPIYFAKQSLWLSHPVHIAFKRANSSIHKQTSYKCCLYLTLRPLELHLLRSTKIRIYFCWPFVRMNSCFRLDCFSALFQ